MLAVMLSESLSAAVYGQWLAQPAHADIVSPLQRHSQHVLGCNPDSVHDSISCIAVIQHLAATDSVHDSLALDMGHEVIYTHQDIC